MSISTFSFSEFLFVQASLGRDGHWVLGIEVWPVLKLNYEL